MRHEMTSMKQKHFDEIAQNERDNDIEMLRLERKRVDMSHMYEAEIASYLKIISGKDQRILILLQTIRKSLAMMQHPRLMQLITRELNFDRFEYSWEEKLQAVKQEISLTHKEEQEIREVGIVLCPKTLKEFYTYLRGAENQVEREAKKQELEAIRKRNVNLEGKRLVIEKEAQR